MAGEKRSLPRFPDDSTNLIKGRTWNAVMDYIERGRVRPGKGIGVEVTANGTIITGSGGGGGSGECAFGGLYSDGGTRKYRGGTVSGGTGNVVVAGESVGSTPSDGTQVWIKVEYSANQASGVLLPNGNVTDAEIETGSSQPDNDPPEDGSPDGKCYINIGSWFNGQFVPSGCGNFNVSWCFGTFSYQRY